MLGRVFIPVSNVSALHTIEMAYHISYAYRTTAICRRRLLFKCLSLPHTTSNRDRWVVVNDSLTSCSHIASVFVTANQRCNLIFRCFVFRDVNLLIRAFITYVWPILGYSSVVWSPYTNGDIDCIKKVQRRFTKRLHGLKQLSYGQRLKHVRLPSLELRRLHRFIYVLQNFVSPDKAVLLWFLHPKLSESHQRASV